MNSTLKKGVLKKALNASADTVIVSVEATHLIQEQMDRIRALPPAMIHLGQALMTVALVQALGDPSEEDRVQMEWLTKGDFGHLYAEAMGTARVRGTVGNPSAPPEDLGKDLGPGILQVRKHHLDAPVSTGLITSSGRVGTDLVEYLEKSEQRACGSNLSVNIEWDDRRGPGWLPFRVRSAHGYLVHVLPQEDESRKDQTLLKWDRIMKALGPLSKWSLSEEPGKASLEILQMLTQEDAPKLLLDQDFELYCTCSEERAARAVTLLGQKDAREHASTLASDEPHSVRCEFCGAVYKIG